MKVKIKEPTTRIVTGCNDCLMCDMNDFCAGYSCGAKQYPDNHIKESRKFQPITPKWCPLKLNDFIFKFTK